MKSGYFVQNKCKFFVCQGVSYNPSSVTRTPTALENRQILDLFEFVNMDWDDDAMVIEHNQKKFLFDYVADMLKGTI